MVVVHEDLAIHALTGELYVMALEAEANVDDELGTPPHAGACSLTSSRPERHNIP